MKGKVLKILKYMGFGFIGLIIIGIVFGKPMADEIIINEENITMDIHQSPVSYTHLTLPTILLV